MSTQQPDAVPAAPAHDQRASRRVRQVVVPSRHVVDTVLAAARRPSFQRASLRDEPRMVEQLYLPAVHQRQQVAVQVAARLLGDRYDIAQGTIGPPAAGGTITVNRPGAYCPGATCVATDYTFIAVVGDSTGLASTPAYVDVTILGTSAVVPDG